MPTLQTARVIDKAITWAVKIANDPSHGYDQTNRWGPNYDCSSFLITAWDQAGVPLKKGGATYTGNMKRVMLRNGFRDVTSTVDIGNGVGLCRGDILLNEQHHVAMYIGDGQIVHASINEKGTAIGGRSGDQTGREICIRKYYVYSKGWQKVLRYSGTAKEEARKVKQYAGVVDVKSYLNVRSDAGSDNPTTKVGGQDFRLPAGMVVSIEAEKGGWGKLTGVNGWVCLDYIKK